MADININLLTNIIINIMIKLMTNTMINKMCNIMNYIMTDLMMIHLMIHLMIHIMIHIMINIMMHLMTYIMINIMTNIMINIMINVMTAWKKVHSHSGQLSFFSSSFFGFRAKQQTCAQGIWVHFLVHVFFAKWIRSNLYTVYLWQGGCCCCCSCMKESLPENAVFSSLIQTAPRTFVISY